MERYVASQVLKLPDFCQSIVQEQLLSRAQGVFLWVRLVMYELKCAESLMNLAGIREILDSKPDELDDLYERLLRKVESRHLHKVEAMIHWVLFAKRPLSLEEFQYAIAIHTNEHRFSSMEELEASMSPSQMTMESIEGSSGGLLEIVPKSHGGGSLVQIIHQSAREFLIRRPRMIGGVEMRLAQSISNAYITDVCISFLKFPKPEPGWKDTYQEMHPFLSYAGHYWLGHLRDASSSRYTSTYDQTGPEEKVGTETQRTIINAQNFLLSEFANSWIQRFKRHNCHPVTIAYEENLHRIIGNAIEGTFEFDTPDLHIIVLERAVLFGDEKTLRTLLKNEKSFDALKPHSDKYWKALYTATMKGYEGIVQLLMEYKAKVKPHCGEYGNALFYAKVNGLERITSYLLTMVQISTLSLMVPNTVELYTLPITSAISP